MREHDRIEPAIHELQNEPVPSEGSEWLYEEMTVRRKLRLDIRLVAALAVSAGIAVINLWPTKSTMAWGQVVQKTLSVTCFHATEYDLGQDGRWMLGAQEWGDGPKNASLVNPPPSGGIYMDDRSDGLHRYTGSPDGDDLVITAKKAEADLLTTERFTLKGLMDCPSIKFDATPTRAVVDGKQLLCYGAKIGMDPGDPRSYEWRRFYVEPTSGRMVRMEQISPGGKLYAYTAIEYPDKLPASIFAPPPPGPRTMTFDLDRDSALLEASFAKGQPFGDGNVVRAVLQSPTGLLLILWTGTPPNGDGSPVPKVAGRRVKAVYSASSLTTSRWREPERNLYRIRGHVVCGVALKLDRPVQGSITLTIPVYHSVLSRPIRDDRGKVRGHRTRSVGMVTVEGVPIIRTLPFHLIDYMNDLRPVSEEGTDTMR